MTTQPNLKELERRTYMSYNQDGLLDIFAGVYVLGFGLGITLDAMFDYSIGLFLPAFLIALVLPLWISAKQKITMPRIGFVKFGRHSQNKLSAIYIGLLASGLVAFFLFAILHGGEWTDFLFQNGLLIVGVGGFALCCLFGYTLGLKRLYIYGAVAFAVLAAGHFLEIFFAYLLIALGAAVIAVGFAMLAAFIKKYPVNGEANLAR
ncbi:MAG: hypothetical protein NWF04_08410 [Candidatus Bathyarchaeota archaeon]|nr:hypothetical protein [Candidatus Bathyarchaeota archaeon]